MGHQSLKDSGSRLKFLSKRKQSRALGSTTGRSLKPETEEDHSRPFACQKCRKSMSHWSVVMLRTSQNHFRTCKLAFTLQADVLKISALKSSRASVTQR